MSRTRSAEATIAGYLYQFDNTIIRILNSSNEDTIIIEGIEDIDIESPEKVKEAIQVKYYEGTDYTPSCIAEPVLQMLRHFKLVQKGDESPVKYYLFAHYKSNTDNLVVDTNGKLLEQSDDISALDFLKSSLLTYTPKNKDAINYWLPESEDDIELDDSQLENFIDILSIDIKAKDINQQYDDVLNTLINKVDNCRDKKEAEDFYYNNSLKIIFHKAKAKSAEGVGLEVENKGKLREVEGNKAKIKRRVNRINSDGDTSGSIQTEIDGYNERTTILMSEIAEFQTRAQELHKVTRTISKADFVKEIDRKAFLFNKWYAWHKGKEKYIDYVIGKLKGANDLARSKNKYLFIDKTFLEDTTGEVKLIDFIDNIILGSFSMNNALATKDKVWTIVLDRSIDEIKEIKGDILEKGFTFSDGGEQYNKFSTTKFLDDPILYSDKNLIIEKAEFQIRIISIDTFKDNYKEIEKEIDVFLYFSGTDFKDKIGDVTSKSSLYIIEPCAGFNNIESVNQIFAKKQIENDYFRIISVSPNLLQVEVTKPNIFKHKNERFTLGSYVKISDEYDVSVLGILKNYKIKDVNEEHSKVNLLKKEPSFILDIQPVGYIKDGEFKKGRNTITIPPSEVEIADNKLLKNIFKHDKQTRSFSFGSIPESIVSAKEKIKVELDGDKFFNKHLAIVGSTGSGKSCTVAKILQNGIALNEDQKTRGILNRSKVLIFDLHGEYYNAFKDDCRLLTGKQLKLPYWLMNSEELENFFIETEGSDHNQKNILKKAITWNKKKSNKNATGSYSEDITYDSPVFFSIKEVLQVIKNYNVAKEEAGIIKFQKTTDGVVDVIEIGEEIDERIFEPLQQYSKGKQVSSFNGKFTGFITRLENKINDERYDFILKQGNEYNLPFIDIVKQIIGYDVTIDTVNHPNKNVTIIDLSGIPYEIISITVAVISRLIFNFAFHWKKANIEKEIETPFLVVYEEAHNYIPKTSEAKFKSVRESVERIAKEGRKYGVSAMIVSQRPSEISETIFSQCNSFVVMRLTNPHDQQYIKKLLPDDVSSITDSLSAFDQRQALIIGDAVAMPAIVEVDALDKDRLPKSSDVEFIQTWRKDWYEMNEFESVISQLTNK